MVDFDHLLALTEALTQSGSDLEDAFWEEQIKQTIKQLFAHNNNNNKNQPLALEQLLDYLVVTAQPEHYDILASLIESLAETAVIEHQGQPHNVLLITAPIAAWSSYSLPDGHLTHNQHAQLLQLLKAYAGSHAKVALLGQLLSFDQLPKSYAQTHALCQQLGHLALDAKPAAIEIDQRDDGIQLLADVKFIVAAIAVPAEAHLFRWQEAATPYTALQQSTEQWQAQCEPILATLFAGCQCQYLAPNGYFHNNRKSDQHMRPLALKAAVQWLSMLTHNEVERIQATIVRCGEDTTEEFRIGLSIDNNPDLVYGSVWPIFSQDEMDVSSANYQDSALLIQNLLTELGVTTIHFAAGLFEPAFCDDCHAPYFPDSTGQLQHPHLPEDIDFSPPAVH